MEHIGEDPAEQDVAPLSAADIVALATSLVAHPQRGPRLRHQIRTVGRFFHVEKLGKVRNEVRAACDHLTLANATATGLAVALLPLCGLSNLHFCLNHDDAGEEAVAAFCAALEQPTCTVEGLTIKGAAFGTRAAAAHLGRCLNVNSTIRWLDVDVLGFCAKEVWTTFSHALTSNRTIRTLMLCELATGNGSHVAATLADSHKLSALREVNIHKLSALREVNIRRAVTINWLPGNHFQATLKDMVGWGNMLQHNSTITYLHLYVLLVQGRGLLVPLWKALLTNTTLRKLVIAGDWRETQKWELPTVDPESASTDADTLNLAAMLAANRSLTYLDIIGSGIVCSAHVFQQGLSKNSTLEELAVRVDAAGAQALMTALAGGSTGSAAPQLKVLSLAKNFVLGMPYHAQCWPTAVAVSHMLASNKTLTELHLRGAPYTNQEWAATILPALADNYSLENLDLEDCAGVDDGIVYDAILELLHSNTHIISIKLRRTPLEKRGKAGFVWAVVDANKEYGAVLKRVPIAPTTSCRLVLCGYPYAGKSTLLQTLIRCHSSDSHRKTAATTTTQRTRGIDIQHVTIDNLTMWIWDFAGQREFHPLQDFIFPNATSVHAATAFTFTFNPIISSHGTAKSRVRFKSKSQFKQEFCYWLMFMRSNAKHGHAGRYKPLVLVVITHRDKMKCAGTSQEDCFREWVRDVAQTFGDVVALDAHNLFFMDATNGYDPALNKFVQDALSLLRQRIDEDVQKVPAICDSIAKALGGGSGGQQLEPIISFADFTELCESEILKACRGDNNAQLAALTELLSGSKDRAARVIAAYLRDAGEVLYIRDLDFLVRNPRWFAHGILGHLIDFHLPDDIDPSHSVRIPRLLLFFIKWIRWFAHGILGYPIDIDPQYSAASQDSAASEDSAASQDHDEEFENGLVSKDFLTDRLLRAIDIVGLNPLGTNSDQLILLMEKLDLCYKTPQKYLIPALFKDEHGKADRGERKRKWELHAFAKPCTFVSRRLQCSDPFRTVITPGFFPRLQVVLKNLADQWEIDVGNCTCFLEKGFCRLIMNGMEILVEYSGYFDYYIDIMIKSYQSQQCTVEFLETKIISEIRRLCASPRGCQGVTLVEAIIRPDCVGEDIVLCRFRESLQVATLEHQVVSGPDLMYSWPAVKDEHGNTVLPATIYEPQDLLDRNRISSKQVVSYPDSNVRDGRRRGVAVIVSMVTYTERGVRSGGHEDEAKVKKLAGELEFEMKLLQDSKAGELQKQLKDIAATSVCAQDESFLCFVMGHGDSTVDGEQFIWDQNGDMIMLDYIVKPFRTCQHLQGKPMVFFVVSCRGSDLLLVHPQPQVHAQQPSQLLNFSEGTEVRYLQELTDCLMVFSTSVGSASARYPGYGTTFVGALVTNLNQDKRQTTDVLGILNHVNEEVTSEEHKAKDGTVFGQCPVVVHTLTKRLYWRRKAVYGTGSMQLKS